MWAKRFDINLRRRGGRLILDADEVPDFKELPSPEIALQGDGDGTFTLRLGRGVNLGRRVTIEVWGP